MERLRASLVEYQRLHEQAWEREQASWGKRPHGPHSPAAHARACAEIDRLWPKVYGTACAVSRLERELDERR